MKKKPPDPRAAIRDSIRAQMLIHTHRVGGARSAYCGTLDVEFDVPHDLGAWDFVDEFIAEATEGPDFDQPELRCAGRMTAASPATGLARVHTAEQAALVPDTSEVDKPRVRRTAAGRALTDPTEN
ncbi:MAG: hypothetical protein QF890_18435 [Myxococcota bacterium]|jgi:hypothetical protein|nr:hypothetical protein [Deltaproteobacteria bacterium]MCP4241773.1 hypothetical protein [bacterium]MDP6075961.1 hypothetical protein [Myxococcota bacterium]MDP6242344.1 hypothetical protein [Myxococcota bacterium]MDP7076039.1 hypothetical protein [Myxococcota bacterium]